MAGKRYALGDLVDLQRGNTYKSALLGKPGPILLGLASIQRDGGFRDDNLKTYGGESADKLLLKPGDLYVSLKDVTQSGDLLGAVARVPSKISLGRVTQDTVKLDFKKKSIPKEFVYWALRSPEYRAYCRSHAIGTTNLSLSRDDFLAFEVPEPTAEQMLLVETLETLDKKIELNRRMNQTLEAIARALFKSWFVDFDPVRAKAEGRDTGLPKHIADLFPDRFVDSEFGEIPEGWKFVRFGDRISFAIGGDWGAEKKDEDHTVKVGIVRGTDIPRLKEGDFSSLPIRYVKKSKFEKRTLTNGDLVLEVSGGSKGQPTGRSLCISETLLERFPYPLIPASFCRRLVPVSTSVGRYLSMHMDWLYEAGETWKYQNQSTGISNFQVRTFLEQERVVVPSDEVGDVYGKTASLFLEKSQSGETDSLKGLRDLLIPALLGGAMSLGENRGR